MEQTPLILASSSPRRRQLLADHGYQFTIIAPSESAEGGVSRGETASELVARLAHQKAQDVARRVAAGLVIGCDTVAECAGQILGKPTSRDHAERMLKTLSGREHYVYSGLCLWQRPSDGQRIEVEVTRLIMDPLTDEDLQAYLDT